MPANARQYREHLYRMRAHPPDGAGFSQARPLDFGYFYLCLSLLPFLVAEYVAEARFSELPGGLIFPVGYFLFWAFFYSYWRPGLLNQQLGSGNGNLWKLSWTLLLQLFKTILSLFFVSSPDRAQVHIVRNAKPATEAPNRNDIPPLPREICQALVLIGLPNCRDWEMIHHRYRMLAKRYHPDLNCEITSVGNRFIQLDLAYRKLSSVRHLYFK
ncbi:MAG: J domain-containing protein [Deltaproteobacteria bacterium]|nr:J domain-containing protein [Deltaproteobacteria bacterium]